MEEMSVEDKAPITLKLRFAGNANRGSYTDTSSSSEVVLKGVLDVEGLLFAAQ